MKILYVGDLSEGGTALMRMRAMQRLGHQVEAINSFGGEAPDVVMRQAARLAWRLGWPLDLEQINRQIIRRVRERRPELIWVDKGLQVSRRTLEEIAAISPMTRRAHYNPDDPFGLFGKRGWRKFLNAIPAYHVHFVPRRENMVEYKSVGAARVVHNVPTRGFDPTIHQPYALDVEFKAAFSADCGFLGAYEQDRATSLKGLGAEEISIRLMHDWPKNQMHPGFLVAPYSVKGTEYAKAISTFKIGLGFLRKANRDRHTSRSIEIPACGTFLLAERTDEHQELFEEGKEAEFFSSNEELIDKAKFYLSNEMARESIARAGRMRCLRSNYDYNSRINLMLEQAMRAED